MNILKVLLLLLLTCCKPEPLITILSGNAMTIDYKVQIGQPLDPQDLKKIQAIILSTFQEINDIHNKWNPHSEISHLNQLKAFEKSPISAELFALLKLADKLFVMTDGRFDPTIEPLQHIWQGRHPSSEEVEAIQPAIGWSKVHFDEASFWKEHDLTRIDLCAIAKGHLVDLLSERLASAGYKNTYVEWGGEIRVNGQHPHQRPWTVCIRNIQDNAPIDTFSLHDEAIATSGDYEQFWEVGGKRYFHVMNPLTLSPLEQHPNSIASVSVIAPSCALADGLATAALVFDNEEQAKVWLEGVCEKFWIATRSSAM